MACAFKNDMRNLANFYQSTFESLKIWTFIGPFPSQKSNPRFNQEKARFNQDKYNFNGINQDSSEILFSQDFINQLRKSWFNSVNICQL